LAVGDYTVYVKDYEGCTDSTPVTIDQPEKLNVTASASPTEVCCCPTFDFSSSVSGGTGSYSYSWDFGDGGTSTSANPSYSYSGSGTYTATLTVTDSGEGCTDSDTATVTVVVYPLPSCAISTDALVVPANSTGHSASIPDAGSGAEYNWSISGGTITASSGNTIEWSAGDAGPITIGVNVTDSNGCASTCETTVTVVNFQLTLDPTNYFNALGQSHIFTATLESSIDGETWVGVPDQDIDFVWTGILNDNATRVTDDNGQAQVTLTSNTPGTITMVASFNGLVAFGSLEQQFNGDQIEEGIRVSLDSNDATKTWVDSRLLLTPETGTNAVGVDHPLTATLQVDYGNGWEPLPGEEITFNKEGGPGELSSTTGTTDGDGQVIVTLTSDVEGTTIVSASWNGVVTENQVSLSASDEATKNWFQPAAQLSITPAEATNEVGITHTFTATLEIDEDGDGDFETTPEGEEVVFAISGVGSLSDDSGTTNESGEASVDVDSSVPGTSTVTASWSGTVAAVTVVANPVSGVKNWVDARLSLSPETGTNPVGDDHELTVFLEINDGTGWSPGAGQNVTFEILSGPGDLDTNPVTTDEDGEAIVVLTSDTEGTTTVQASWDGTVADQSISRTSNEAEKEWVSGLEAENLEVTICDNTDANLTLRAIGSNIDPDDNPITFSINSSPDMGMVSEGFGDVTYPEEGNVATTEVTYSPAEDDTGEYSFTYLVEDDFGEFDIGRVTVTIEYCGLEEGGGAGGLEEEIVINEIAWSGTRADPTHEWIELLNNSDKEVDLTGWTLRWRKDETKEWKEVRLKGTIQAEDYYILERLSDETISDLKANLIYDAEEPHKLPLLDEGEVMQLLNNDGLIVDTANAEKPELGWPGGSISPVNSMERIDPEIEDLRVNWATNEGIIIKGRDRDIVDLTASALHINEKTLLARIFTGEPLVVEAGRILSFTVRQPADVEGDPKVLLGSINQAVAGGAGSVMTGEGAPLSAQTVPGLPNYQVTFDTSKVEPGTYKLYVVVGSRIIHKKAFRVVEEG